MVDKQDFFYDSVDKKTKIHCLKWIPKGANIKAVLQIAHGMLEHIKRYDDFASYIAEKGILVVGNDHLGHGDSVLNEDCRGFFCEKNGNKAVIEDINELKKLIKNEYPNIPYFLLGHSMGSYLIRQYITIYDNEINGAIIMGTGNQPYALVKSGQLITKLIASVKGWTYRSVLVNNMTIGGYNKNFKPNRTNVDWLSCDEKQVDDYINDSKINFIFTLNAYNNMFQGILSLYDKKNINKVPKNLPIFLVSGENDPVGGFGKGIKKLYEMYKNIGMNDVTIKLYKNFRHEILNEIQRKTVYDDVFNWINKHII